MSLTLNMVGGGGGGLSATDALLRVQAPAGSIVTISKGSVSKSDNGHENADINTIYDYYFIIHQSQFDSVNAWTVTATRGDDTNTSTIIIDSPDEYGLVFSYHVPILTYQEVEYIESTGGTSSSAKQYINTNYATTDKVRIKSKFAFIAANIYFAKQAFSSGQPLGFNYESDGFAAQIAGTHGGQTVIHTGVQAVVGQVYELDFNTRASNPYIKLDDTTILEYTTGSVTYMNASIFIFAGNHNGSPGYHGNYRLYNWTMYNSSGDVIREYYPCYRRSDSVAGLYDKANGVFYTNSGTGTFIVGADV